MRYLVVIAGTINTSRFWPEGTSDADTIKLDITDGGFFYGVPHSNGKLKRTDVFEEAYCLVDNEKRPLISDKRIVDIRLQGVDAPELHYPVEFEGSDALTLHYRQYFGKTATADLLSALGGAGKKIECEIWSYIDKPSDLFDEFGRAIGYAFTVEEDSDKFELNINEWLLANGLAYPTFYSTMQMEELEYLAYIARQAARYKRGLWKYTSNEIRKSQLKLKFNYSDRKFDREKDRGPVIFPKVFRRASRWLRGIEIGEIDPKTTLPKFLKSQPPVTFSYLDDIVSFGPRYAIPVYKLEEVITGAGRISISPLRVVFYEKPSFVFNKRGIEIKSFEDPLYDSFETISGLAPGGSAGSGSTDA